MPVCPSCHSSQPDGAAFCDNCGAKLETPQVAPFATAVMGHTPTVVASTCPQCGAPVNPDSPFCDNCGALVAADAAPPAGPQAPIPPTPSAPAAGGMVCKNCGAQLQPGSAFCDMCGAPVSAPVAQPQYQPQPVAQQPVYPQPPTQPQYQQPQYAPPSPMAPQQIGEGAIYPPAGGRFVVQQTGAQLTFPPGKAEIIVGREDAASNIFPEVDLNDHGGDEGGVSRRHARVALKDGQFYIEDLGSVNFTFVNHQKLAPNQPHPLNNGDEVQFGRVKLNFYL
ncbi:MAG: zinc-ribbon domain-containing protein [Anaerolineae bacterium]|nr:zinc-ribbon domain-containing protein [Anaerolineae bacterium]